MSPISFGDTARLDELSNKLGSDDFEVRDEAFKELWKMGELAVPTLEGFAEGDDPELAIRAGEILRKRQLGLTPDSPAELETQLERFFDKDATPREKRAVLDYLREENNFDVVIRLRDLETEPETSLRIDQILAYAMTPYITTLFETGETEKALDLLLRDGTFTSLRRRAIYLKTEGLLDDELEAVKTAKGEKEQARYLMALRVKGDAKLLRAEARRLGDQPAEVVAALSLGDLGPWIEFQKGQDRSTLGQKYMSWLEARESGNVMKAALLERQMGELPPSTNAKLNTEQASHLFRMGLVVEGERVGAKVPRAWTYYVQSQKQDSEVRANLGLPEGKVTSEWISEAVPKLFEGVEPTRGELLYSRRFDSLLRYFKDRGLDNIAVSLMEEAAKLPKYDIGKNCRALFTLAPEAFVKFAAKALEKEQISFVDLIVALYPYQNLAFRDAEKIVLDVYERLEKHFPNITTEEKLRLGLSLMGPPDTGNTYQNRPYESLAELPRLQEAFRNEFEYFKKEVDPANLSRFALLSKSVEFGTMRTELLTEMLDLHGPDEGLLISLVGLYLSQRNYEKAAALYEKFEEPLKRAELLFQKDFILSKAGKKDDGDLLGQALRASHGSGRPLSYIAQVESTLGNSKKAEEYCRQILLLLSPKGIHSRSGFSSVLFPLYADIAFDNENWQVSRVLREAELSFDFRSSFFSACLSRYHSLLAEAALEVDKKGDREAGRALLKKAYALVQSNGYLANDFFPHLRRLGFLKLHDELYAESIEEVRSVIEKYPRSDNALNDFGWLSSRALKSLDEAEEMMKEALRLRPHSAAYLDTMAEIFFARGDRAKAIEWGRKAIQTDPYDDELQRQFTRFLKGKIPSR